MMRSTVVVAEATEGKALLGSVRFWPVFNVADAAITVGVIFMILDILGLGKHRASNPL